MFSPLAESNQRPKPLAVSGRYTVSLKLRPERVKLTCHNCKSEAGKFGFHKGFQRYRCRQCGKTFSDIPERPLDTLRIDPEKAYQIIHMLAEGVGVRAAARLCSVHRDTVLAVLEVAGEKCARLLDSRLTNLKSEQIQIDEIYSFVNCLQQNTTIDDQLRGDQYTFLAVDPTTKLIVHWFVGKRDKDNALTFLRGLKARLINERFQLTSDGFAAYCGHLGSVFQVFRERIDYGTEIKHFATSGLSLSVKGNRRQNPVVCQWIKRTARIGNPVRANITVNHAERNNLSIRLFNRRFTRKTLGFSKKLHNHKRSVALQTAHFNFCRKHSTHGRTPAQAAGLTEHVWTVPELLQG